MTNEYLMKQHHKNKPASKPMNDIIRKAKRAIVVSAPIPESHQPMNDIIRNEAKLNEIDLSQLNEEDASNE